MPFVPIQRIAAAGVIKDLPGHDLPPEAWTHALNVRFAENRAKRFEGESSIMDPVSGPPGFIMVVDNAGDVFWLYAEAEGSGSKVYVFNSGVHSDISQLGGYDVTNYRDWNGDIFQGVPILNYGNGVPQYWPTPNSADLLEDLPNWPAMTTAKILRAFGNYMIALNLTDADGNHPHRQMWSDGAGPGELPASWDVEDPAFDANHVDLSDTNSGQILDGVALNDVFITAKSRSLWVTRYIGGQEIFSVKPRLRAAGLICARCMTPVNRGLNKIETAFLMTGEDLGTFDGQDFESVIEKKDRKFLVSDIDPINFENSFVLDNRSQGEAWFCYPENGETNPTMACVWNYKDNNITFREFNGNSAASGPVEGASSKTWANVVGTWIEQDPAKWQEASREKLVVAVQDEEVLIQMDTGDTFNGTTFTGTLERTGLAVTGRDRQDNPIVDVNSRKIITRVWPQIKGGPVLIQLGGSDSPDPDTVVWQAGVTYDPSLGVRHCDPAGVDSPANWVYNAIRFSADVHFELEGYGIDVEVLSEL